MTSYVAKASLGLASILRKMGYVALSGLPSLSFFGVCLCVFVCRDGCCGRSGYYAVRSECAVVILGRISVTAVIAA